MFTRTLLGVAGVMLSICLINGFGLIIEPLKTYKMLSKKANGI
jgi:hypothetical protein